MRERERELARRKKTKAARVQGIHEPRQDFGSALHWMRDRSDSPLF